jgi:hypothetical protein
MRAKTIAPKETDARICVGQPNLVKAGPSFATAQNPQETCPARRLETFKIQLWFTT